jgi:hypothetical protein
MRNTWRNIAVFFASRWRGHAPLERVFWRDMLLVGTAINVAMALIAITLLTSGAPPALAITLFLAPLPYNLFLYMGVWAAGAQARPVKAAAIRFGATLWLVASVIV